LATDSNNERFAGKAVGMESGRAWTRNQALQSRRPFTGKIHRNEETEAEADQTEVRPN
jgi:hypothetical protein